MKEEKKYFDIEIKDRNTNEVLYTQRAVTDVSITLDELWFNVGVVFITIPIGNDWIINVK